MAIKFEKIKPGMVLLDIHSQRMGHTTMRELGCWEVRIISVCSETKTAMVNWNGNSPKRWFASELERLYTKPPKAYRDQERRRNGEWV
jgi:hypothetical protein